MRWHVRLCLIPLAGCATIIACSSSSSNGTTEHAGFCQTYLNGECVRTQSSQSPPPGSDRCPEESGAGVLCYVDVRNTECVCGTLHCASTGSDCECTLGGNSG